MMHAADEVIVVADSTKFGRQSLAHLCPLGDVAPPGRRSPKFPPNGATKPPPQDLSCTSPKSTNNA